MPCALGSCGDGHTCLDDGTASCCAWVSNYLGCFPDQGNPRILPDLKGNGFSMEQCIDLCRSEDYAASGLQWFGECWCGDTPYGTPVADDNCDTPCVLGAAGMCGGSWHNSVFQDTTSNYAYVGCFEDQGHPRRLPMFPGNGFNIDRCISECAFQGAPYAGLQWFGECFCGDYVDPEMRVPDADCDTPCRVGDGMCGGSWRNSVYKTTPNVCHVVVV
jgi:hypothetical protein